MKKDNIKRKPLGPGYSNGYQPQPLASADNPYLNLDYSGYHKNLIQQ